MKLTAKQTRHERYGDSDVYYFSVLVDGEPIITKGDGKGPDEDGVPDTVREFAIQVQDGADAAAALRRFLVAKKAELETSGAPVPLPEVEV